MAELVLGVGMSHSSLIATTDPRVWLAHEAIDRDNPYLRDRAGRPVTFAELEQANGRRYQKEASLEHVSGQVRQTVAAVQRLQAVVAAAGADVLVVLGDDQVELLDQTNMPALAVYHDHELRMGTRLGFASYQAQLGDVSTMMREYAMDAPHVFAGHAPLALHLIHSLLAQGFDVAAMKGVPEDRDGAGIGHAFGLVERKLNQPRSVPLVPVFVNTYWPPNQLPVSRCYDLGLAIGAAIRSFDADLRIALVASGGLSHFSTDEELDHHVLDACRSGDEHALRSLPPHLLNSGSSEIRNWVATAAACRDLEMTWHEYIPVYRTAAGTGVGLAFAAWERRH
ncbi:MAG: hypothetical protein J2P38_05220 [Candidatus Dormibacteraeota bacterium]|nr:hypothetical protein [Candidatus Dormibacteraeota bacterium]